MLLKVKVKPSSDKVKVEFDGSCLKVWLKSWPEKGKANRELFHVLKEIFGDFEFVSGETSKEKLIKIDTDINNISKIIKERT